MPPTLDRAGSDSSGETNGALADIARNILTFSIRSYLRHRANKNDNGSRTTTEQTRSPSPGSRAPSFSGVRSISRSRPRARDRSVPRSWSRSLSWSRFGSMSGSRHRSRSRRRSGISNRRRSRSRNRSQSRSKSRDNNAKPEHDHHHEAAELLTNVLLGVVAFLARRYIKQRVTGAAQNRRRWQDGSGPAGSAPPTSAGGIGSWFGSGNGNGNGNGNASRRRNHHHHETRTGRTRRVRAETSAALEALSGEVQAVSRSLRGLADSPGVVGQGEGRETRDKLVQSANKLQGALWNIETSANNIRNLAVDRRRERKGDEAGGARAEEDGKPRERRTGRQEERERERRTERRDGDRPRRRLRREESSQLGGSTRALRRRATGRSFADDREPPRRHRR